jgi:hypothetical protein
MRQQLADLIQLPANCGVYDIALGATWDKKDWPFVRKQFRYFNEQYRLIRELSSVLRANANNPNLYKYFRNKINQTRNELMPHIFNFDKKILRKYYGQSVAEHEPIQGEIAADLVTVQGLTSIVDNFLLLDVMHYDALATGTGTGTPFGGDQAMQAQNAEVYLPDEGFVIGYGTEARHGAPFPASLATANVSEIGIKSQMGTTYTLYSRSKFPSNKVIAHANMLDIYTIQHISFFKST